MGRGMDLGKSGDGARHVTSTTASTETAPESRGRSGAGGSDQEGLRAEGLGLRSPSTQAVAAGRLGGGGGKRNVVNDRADASEGCACISFKVKHHSQYLVLPTPRVLHSPPRQVQLDDAHAQPPAPVHTPRRRRQHKLDGGPQAGASLNTLEAHTQRSRTPTYEAKEFVQQGSGRRSRSGGHMNSCSRAS